VVGYTEKRGATLSSVKDTVKQKHTRPFHLAAGEAKENLAPAFALPKRVKSDYLNKVLIIRYLSCF
jgi:hypothetical protein